MDTNQFKCSLCWQLLVDPIQLDLGQIVCFSHVKRLVNSEELQSESPSSDLLKRLQQQDPRVIISEARETILRLESLLVEPTCLVYEYFEQIKREIDAKRERLKFEIDEFSDELVQNVTRTQSDCMRSGGKKGSGALDKAIVDELKKAVKQYESIRCKGADFEMVNKRILGLKFKCDRMLAEYQEAFLRERIEVGVECSTNFCTNQMETVRIRENHVKIVIRIFLGFSSKSTIFVTGLMYFDF
jgi:hypothetical protein